jgi:predicted aspartyl protease
MIRGHVSTTLEPVIELGLVQGDTVTVIPAIIDTGFSGMLCLAERYVAQLDVTFQFLEPYELANGDIVGQEVEVLMTASQDTLIGAALLQPYTLTIDYPDHAVRLTKNRRKKQHIT